MRILIIGKNGMLGSDVVRAFKDEECFCFDKEDLDITDENLVKNTVAKIKPRFLINCSGYTDVDGCESNPELALSVNGKAPGFLAKACHENNATLIHISTDYVFDGTISSGYKEKDGVNPINVYGQSKALGEKSIQSSLKEHFIVRTSWLFGKNGKNFVNTMLVLSQKEKELNVVDDQKGSPTYTKDLAFALKEIISYDRYGIYHITNSGSCTWYAYAKKIFELSGKNISVHPVKSSSSNRRAKRPACSVLINTQTAPLRPWHEALNEFLQEKGTLT